MLLGTVQMSGESLTSADMRDIGDSLRRDSIKLLSLRGCRMTDRHFRRMADALAGCKSISQLNLNLGVVCSRERMKLLASALTTNKSLTGLFLHGSPLGDDGLALLMDSLAAHPGITSLDLGDCRLGDHGIQLLCRLLPEKGAKPGLRELTLSANPAVTPAGWAHLAVAVSSDSCLRVLNVDYNRLGDAGVGMLAVAAAACKSLEVLDLESVGASDQGARVLLTLVSGFSRSLTDVVVKENNINTDIERELSQRLGQDHQSSADSSSSSDSSDSDSERSGSEDAPVRYGQRPRPVQGGGPSPREQLRSVKRTAMRLLKRTKSSDGVRLGKAGKKQKHPLSDSDSDSSEAEISLYLSNMDFGGGRKTDSPETGGNSGLFLAPKAKSKSAQELNVHFDKN